MAGVPLGLLAVVLVLRRLALGTEVVVVVHPLLLLPPLVGLVVMAPPLVAEVAVEVPVMGT